ncbi:RING finger protein 11 [Pteropus alecto]|uniref:RING finger protein 11 n=1 Tax=Pteropus alecto TaxID=9402 RepID=L5KEG7_PTEAL|nr:RING finger protein 11 [Pteropus alecto]
MGNCLKSPSSDDILAPEPQSPHWHHGRARSGERTGPSLPRQERGPLVQLPEEEQIRIAQRISHTQHLPKGLYDCGRDGEGKVQEGAVCLVGFVNGDATCPLPCLHFYHLDDIDEWLRQSVMCPCCRKPVHVAQPSS